MHVELTSQEREILVNMLEREIAELGPEIRHTDARSYREDLKAMKQLLFKMLEHLRMAEAA